MSFLSREILLLADESRTKDFRLEDLCGLVSHELSHQWLGNMLTPSSWNYAWIKESFATFFQYMGVDLVRSDCEAFPGADCLTSQLC